MPGKAIEIEGLKEFQRAARRAVDTDLPRRLGEAHRFIGQMVIDKLEPRPDPAAVGEGAGAAVKASASKRDVLLRVGGAHRKHPPQSIWGKRRVTRPGMRAPKRPYIRETIDRHYDEIADAYLQAIADAMDGAFAKTEP